MYLNGRRRLSLPNEGTVLLNKSCLGSCSSRIGSFDEMKGLVGVFLVVVADGGWQSWRRVIHPTHLFVRHSSNLFIAATNLVTTEAVVAGLLLSECAGIHFWCRGNLLLA